MRFRAAKSVALASILSDFFAINIHRTKCRQDADSTVLCNYVVKIGNF